MKFVLIAAGKKEIIEANDYSGVIDQYLAANEPDKTQAYVSVRKPYEPVENEKFFLVPQELLRRGLITNSCYVSFMSRVGFSPDDLPAGTLELLNNNKNALSKFS